MRARCACRHSAAFHSVSRSPFESRSLGNGFKLLTCLFGLSRCDGIGFCKRKTLFADRLQKIHSNGRRVDKNSPLFGEFCQVTLELGRGSHVNGFSLKLFKKCVRKTPGVGVEHRSRLRDQQFSLKYGIIGDIRTAQVRYPRDIVERFEKEADRTALGEFFAYGTHFFPAFDARPTHFGNGTRHGLRPLGPDTAPVKRRRQELQSASRKRLFTKKGILVGNRFFVDRHHRSSWQAFTEPVRTSCEIARGSTNQFRPRRELSLRLFPIAAVSSKRQFVREHKERSRTAFETRERCAQLPMLGDILAKVRVARQNKRAAKTLPGKERPKGSQSCFILPCRQFLPQNSFRIVIVTGKPT